MNTITRRLSFSRSLIATAVASTLLAACAAAPVAPEGSAEVRSKLAQLQADPNLASRAPLAIKEADAAVRVAETPEADEALAYHRVYIADRKVEIARAQAQTRLAEDQRPGLVAQRESARLDSRTREADLARSQVATARSDADAALAATAYAEAQSAELQRQIAALQAEVTDRGIVLTLGDVLFATDSAELRTGATSNLDPVVAFLGRYTERTVAIEGHTDSQGSDEYNQGLSQRRADSVRSHLVRQGIASSRLSATGAGESAPVAGNDTAAGRQQNRRVELIISNPKLASN